MVFNSFPIAGLALGIPSTGLAESGWVEGAAIHSPELSLYHEGPEGPPRLHRSLPRCLKFRTPTRFQRLHYQFLRGAIHCTDAHSPPVAGLTAPTHKGDAAGY